MLIMVNYPTVFTYYSMFDDDEVLQRIRRAILIIGGILASMQLIGCITVRPRPNPPPDEMSVTSEDRTTGALGWSGNGNCRYSAAGIQNARSVHFLGNYAVNADSLHSGLVNYEETHYSTQLTKRDEMKLFREHSRAKGYFERSFNETECDRTTERGALPTKVVAEQPVPESGFRNRG
ncbi:unnamed protein product [Dibothriocephalus latus]|uniref:Uncharacterized protein n=1 Tax=Dibothriocephalus latus TaxID=60516 RepID=A0A3P7P7P3_DIBLA|nr:unnamed protein product [Dibothriocephalus latus]